jgi:hypothetical protein
MVRVDPSDYINKINGGNVPTQNTPTQSSINLSKDEYETQPQAEIDAFIIPRTDTLVTGQGMLDGGFGDGATPYSGYDNEALTYSKNLFKDDTIESIISFLERMRLTRNVCRKFAEIYIIAASQDNVLTWSNAWLLQRRANMFKLEMLEFKNTLLGPDADSLLFGDFDLVIEMFNARLEARNGRSFEGFERKAGVTNYTYSHNFDNAVLGNTNKDERSGLAKLGKFNPFRGN